MKRKPITARLKRKEKTLPGVGSSGLVSLRRYLKDNLHAMEVLLANWKGTKDGRRYWKKGAAKIRNHLKTVKAIEKRSAG